MHPHAVLFWMVLLSMAGGADGVCRTRFGNAPGCAGDSATCPMTTGVASNVVALAAATTATAVISVKSLLPFRLQHVFSRSVLDTLTTIARHSAIAGPYDFAGKTVSDIRSAAHQGLVSFHAGGRAYQFSFGQPLHFTNQVQFYLLVVLDRACV